MYDGCSPSIPTCDDTRRNHPPSLRPDDSNNEDNSLGYRPDLEGEFDYPRSSRKGTKTLIEPLSNTHKLKSYNHYITSFNTRLLTVNKPEIIFENEKVFNDKISYHNKT